MRYCILVEKTSNRGGYPQDRFYSSNGITTVDNADTYPSFEDAQPKVKYLRKMLPEMFISAVVYPGHTKKE